MSDFELSSLNGITGFKINGEAVGDSSGGSVASAGDVNGDGFDDLIIGANSLPPFGDESGVSYVVFGKAGGFSATLELSNLDGIIGFQINRESTIDYSDYSVASAGDVNGDGFDDMIIGAANTDTGTTYVVFGKVGGFAANFELSSLNGSNGFQINGEEMFGYFGGSVSSAGDVNGDGFDDLIIGAANTDTGTTYVVFGKVGGFAANLELSNLNGSNGFQINGEEMFDHFGGSVSSAGDVNGDGFDDLIIGAWGAFLTVEGAGVDAVGYRPGASYVVFGKAGDFAATLESTDLNGSTGFRINGKMEADFSGCSVASAGDVNGDGFDDLIIGADGADQNGDESGTTYVVFGKVGGFAANLELSDLNGSNGFQINGEERFDHFGFAVASAGDVNGDGFDDMIIGANSFPPFGDESGASYVVFGKAGGFTANLELSSLDGSNGFKINGETAGDRSGFSVASAGDVNGDGFDDLIIGAFGSAPNGIDSGASYVIFGSATIGGAVPSWTFSHENPADMMLFAHMAADSYNGTDAYRTLATHSAPTGWSVLDSVDDNGMQATAYQEDATGRVVISYRGTDHNGELFATSIPLGGGIGEILGARTVSYLQAAVDFYQSVVDRVGGHESVAFAGHSLGGMIAGYLANITGKQAMLFASGPHSLLLEHLNDDVVRWDGDYGYLDGTFDDSGIRHTRIDGEVLGLAVEFAKDYGPDIIGGLIKLIMPWYLDGLGSIAELALDERFGDATVTGVSYPDIVPGSDIDGLLNATKLHSMPLHLTMLAAEKELGFIHYKDVPGFLSGFFVDGIAQSVDGSVSADIYRNEDEAKQMFQEIVLSHNDIPNDVLTPLLTQAEILIAPIVGMDFGISDGFDDREVATLASRLLIEAAARSLHDGGVDFDGTTGLARDGSQTDWVSIDLNAFGASTSWYALSEFADVVLDTLDLEDFDDTGHFEIKTRIAQTEAVVFFSPNTSRLAYSFTGTGADELVIGAASVGGIGVMLSGRAGNDILIGTLQNDVLRGGTGRNVLMGGDGDDIYYANGAVGTYTLIADSKGRDRLYVEGSLPSLDAPVDRYGDGALALRINGGVARVEILEFFGLSVLGEALKKGAGHIEYIFDGSGNRYSIAIGVEKIIGEISYGFSQLKTAVKNVAVAARDTVDDFRGGVADLFDKALNVLGFGEEDSFTFSGILMGLEHFSRTIFGGAGDGLADSRSLAPGAAPADPSLLIEIDTDLDGTTDASFTLQGDFSDYDIAVTSSDGNTVFQVQRAAAAKFDIYGTAGDEAVVGTRASERLGGLGGNDTLKARGGADVLDGGAGNDRLDGGGGTDDLYGGKGDDIYVIIDADDKVFEYYDEGQDLVLSRVNYTLTINVENLTLTGAGNASGTGNGLDNLIIGNSRANVLSGMAGNDTLLGQRGADTLSGGTGDDTLNGGSGTDVADYSSAAARVTVSLASGTATGGDGNDTLVKIEGIIGSAHNDLLRGNSKPNTILAGAGNDSLFGGRGKDNLDGGDGDDVLSGKNGRDILTGGLGVDHFAFDAAIDEGVDRVTDFEDGTDIIEIGGAVFGDLAITSGGGGADTRITLASGTIIVLEGIDSNLIDATDFLFV